jgi:hypothetical protein
MAARKQSALSRHEMTADEYQQQAQVTCSNMFFGEYVNIRELIETINECIVAIAKLDKAKKMLFYGRGITSETSPKLNDLKRDPFATLGSIPMTGDDEKILHALIGAPTEAGELLEIVRDALHAYLTGEKKTLDFNGLQMVEEWGGILWYAAVGLDGMQTSFGEVFQANIAQLRARYKDKFDAAEANNRNLAFEKSVMSSVVGVATPETYSGHGPTADEEIERFVRQDRMTRQDGESHDEWSARIESSIAKPAWSIDKSGSVTID